MHSGATGDLPTGAVIVTPGNDDRDSPQSTSLDKYVDLGQQQDNTEMGPFPYVEVGGTYR